MNTELSVVKLLQNMLLLCDRNTSHGFPHKLKDLCIYGSMHKALWNRVTVFRQELGGYIWFGWLVNDLFNAELSPKR